jgi:cyclophilin family peptidyl-prolyl cis-trans isomerase
MKLLITTLALFSLSFFSHAESTNPKATFHTNKGDITIELFPQEAPVTVANFIDYAESGFYNGTIFHRVIPRFVIQGGGFTKDMSKKTTKAPISNEANNGLKNDFLTLSMARTNDPNSATSQFFINLSKNTNLDYSKWNPGYAVFARVIEGEFVVRDIAKQATGNRGQYQDVPKEAIIIESVAVQKSTSKAQ